MPRGLPDGRTWWRTPGRRGAEGDLALELVERHGGPVGERRCTALAVEGTGGRTGRRRRVRRRAHPGCPGSQPRAGGAALGAPHDPDAGGIWPGTALGRPGASSRADSSSTGLLGGFLLLVTGRTAQLEAVQSALAIEIAERTRAEEAMRQTRSHYRTLLRIIRLPVGV